MGCGSSIKGKNKAVFHFKYLKLKLKITRFFYQIFTLSLSRGLRRGGKNIKEENYKDPVFKKFVNDLTILKYLTNTRCNKL
jgi:hypothetical protein